MTSRPDRRTVESPTEPAVASSQVLSVGCWVGPGGDALAAALSGDGSESIEAAWGWRLSAIGGERRATASAWAARIGAAEVASLRELARAGTAVRLVLGREMPADADLDSLLEGDAIVMGTAALPANTVEAYRIGEQGGRLRTVPLFRWSEAFRMAQPLVEEFLSEGPPSGVSVRMRSASDEAGLCSVDTMLIDACDVALEVLPGIESVSAIGRSPNATNDARVLAAIARSLDGAVVSIDLADAGGWERSVELVGPAGRLHVGDRSIVRWSRAGAVVERMELTSPADAVAACVESLRTLARIRGGREDRARQIARLALADAARLSIRTGNAESPASVEAIAARP